MLLTDQVILEIDVPNKNNRIYSAVVVADIVAKNQHKTIFGMIDCPASLQISLLDASHVTTNLRVQGTILVGDVRVLDTPKGKILKELLDAGVKIDFRTAGACKTKYQDPYDLVESYELVTIFATPNGA